MTGPTASQTPRNVPTLLARLREQQFSGTVTISGTPGGTLHLRDGLVGAVETPGAPSAETVLLRSRRISEVDWTAARTTGRAGGGLAAALVAGGSIGAADLEVLCTAAVFDGVFAMALSPSGSWQVDDSAVPAELVAHPGIEPQQLTREASRRVALLSRLWGPPRELAGVRVRPTSRAESPTVPLAPRYRDILLSANGRRIPRDIAFALGRGVFPVMLDLVRMSARHLVQLEIPGTATTVPSVAPRTAGTGEPPSAAASPLPRRMPGVRLPSPAPSEAARLSTAAGADPAASPPFGARDGEDGEDAG
ncbi:DUF4388 domain-containing protein [Peterkaempfera bronchialis]|uniref:DUF4388 domain-containing protein n=1 Tax=Peterkaempfera bronchialis TaxID=2126346 RepID=UPI001E5B0911|nr:hypothetical protein [Peterkaempfera bronchialis]